MIASHHNALTLKSVSFSYSDKQQLLKNVFLDVAREDFVGVVGPNGAGKSTLLKIIAGLITADAGTVEVFGKDVRTAVKYGSIGYVPQASRNIEGFPITVKEFLMTTMRASNAEVSEYVERCALKNELNKRLDNISGGQRQLVYILRALLQRPQMLVMDEPTSGIDAENVRTVFALLRYAKASGVTIIMVCHDIRSIVAEASRILCVNRGICFYDTATRFREHHLHEHLLFEFPKI